MADRKLYKFNLVKAQKFLDKLRASPVLANLNQPKARRGVGIGLSNQLKGGVSLSSLVQLSSEVQKVTDAFNKALLNSKNELESRINVIRDYKNLKDFIYTTNAKVGLSKVLTEIDLLTEERKLYEDLRESTRNFQYTKENISDALANYIQYMENSSNTGNSFFADNSQSISFRLYSEEELDDVITKYTQSITKLDDERDKLNANTQVEFSFSKESAKILGI